MSGSYILKTLWPQDSSLIGWIISTFDASIFSQLDSILLDSKYSSTLVCPSVFPEIILFSKIIFYVDDPIYVDKEADAKELEKINIKVEKRINFICEKADKIAGHTEIIK